MSAPPLSSVERVTLFITALHATRAQALLAELAESKRITAQRFCQHLSRCDSATRQARLAREFGMHDDGAERLRALVGVGGAPRLEAALSQHIPPPLRCLFPPAQAEALSPALNCQAQRLVHEAIRR